MSDLAVLGGSPVLPDPLPPYPSMGRAEEEAAAEAVRSGCLSGFYGSPGPEFLGGPRVRAFEQAWAARYGTAYAVSVNSATSGLIAAMGAIGLGPGDEVIVPPWTMSATVVAPLFYGAIPVFADIEEDTFCIDVGSVEAALSNKTRAILTVNLFGHPARLAILRELADQKGIFLVEDNAQAPLAVENGQLAGTVGHIGIFSLNFHKHIHTGEGGVCVTDDETLATSLQLIRNHGENMVEDWGIADITNMVGFNFRLTEIGAAVGLAQLADIDNHLARRRHIAEALTEGTCDLEGWTPPRVREGCTHSYYEWVARLDATVLGITRQTFSKALAAEGFPHFTGYVEPLYRLPLFRQRKAIGRDGFPFTLTQRTYDSGMCPVVERLHRDEALLFECCAFDLDERTLERLVEAVRKIHAERDALRPLGEN